MPNIQEYPKVNCNQLGDGTVPAWAGFIIDAGSILADIRHGKNN